MKKHNLTTAAIAQTLFPKTSLAEAFNQLQFIQADPIQSPARAQDLILRHRVIDYKNGDLASNYSQLKIEEDFLYAHGFMTEELWKLLHPRTQVELTDFDNKVLKAVKEIGVANPKKLQDSLGKHHERNWWGGKSQATRMSLERLHYYGLVKIIARNKGVRTYAAFSPPVNNLSQDERIQKIILAVVNVLSPVTSKTLNQALFRIRQHFGDTASLIQKLIADGILGTEVVDGIKYIISNSAFEPESLTDGVRFLAPFDPLVWDRVRFEHLWGWAYRFEAYVPKHKRVRGYYAMPLMWREKIIGWANIDKQVNVELGFVSTKPKDKQFKTALAEEIERFRVFISSR